MEAVARVVTEFFMMVLCVCSAPVDQQEVRIDLLGDRGYVDTMIVRREEVGFTIHGRRKRKLVKLATIVPKEGAENVFVCRDEKGNSETIDLAQGIEGLNVSELRTKDRLRLKTTDGGSIALNRSKDVLFLTPSVLKRTYVVH
jgi:hypothetical protein